MGLICDSFDLQSDGFGLGRLLDFFTRDSRHFEQTGDSMNCSFLGKAFVFIRHSLVSIFTDASTNSSSSESVWVKAGTNVLYEDSDGDGRDGMYGDSTVIE